MAMGTRLGWAAGRWSDPGGSCGVLHAAGGRSSDAAADGYLVCSIANMMTKQ